MKSAPGRNSGCQGDDRRLRHLCRPGPAAAGPAVPIMSKIPGLGHLGTDGEERRCSACKVEAAVPLPRVWLCPRLLTWMESNRPGPGVAMVSSDAVPAEIAVAHPWRPTESQPRPTRERDISGVQTLRPCVQPQPCASRQHHTSKVPKDLTRMPVAAD
ncbi:hypothetical protein NDU88_005573 [Pleurodeles waltl]|uniref:Uncharacterized protein n=1 Tax=Pleurodeles waltl TaxID=8319 RepID=A0AAV7UKF8_PLEWA|nr:hypothetical protein NDU88_005573 [Pleurodeles waltl]